MLEPPPLPDQTILSRAREAYGLPVNQITFLPIGADVNTAVYRVETSDGAPYFLKLRKGAFDETSVLLPQFLQSQSIRAVIAPLETRAGGLSARLDEYRMILYPYFAGKDGYEVSLSDEQWPEFGASLKAIHAARLPATLARRIHRETFSPRHRENVAAWLEHISRSALADPVAGKLAAFFLSRRGVIERLLAHAGRLADALRASPPEFVLCHSDIHPGNLLIGGPAADEFHIVDWDAPIFAPKERDLMLIGGTTSWTVPRIAALFYQGYGPPGPNPLSLAFYRCERVIEDLSAYSDQLFGSTGGGDDREQSYRYCISSFLPNHEIDLAMQVDPGIEI